ncbi:MAG: alpha/beta fold hydrolase [Verrucomicrobia bacterium]|nr:alpha/beta fold hydrolase [Verrucomicrobiota bacterium]
MVLHFHTLGEGQPLILLHGLLGSLHNWLPLARKFAGRFKVLAVDQRNHGLSPHSPEFGYDQMAGDLHELLNAQGLTRAHVLGHSMGGKTAMQFALLYPDQVEKLVVVDISPRAHVPKQTGTLQSLLALDLRRFQHRAEIDAALATSVPDEELRQFLLTNVARTRPGGSSPGTLFHWKANLTAIWENRQRLGAALASDRPFTKPALFLRGGKSDYVTDGDLDLIRRLFPHAVLQTIPEAGHWVHTDAPQEFFRLVTEFLGEPIEL